MPSSAAPATASGSQARVVIGQRERTIALRAMPGGLVAHTLDEQRDINDARSILGDAAEISTDPEMVQLAKQLIDRQTAAYDPSDLEDRYETRLPFPLEFDVDPSPSRRCRIRPVCPPESSSPW